MRTILKGLAAAAVLVLAGSLAHADPFPGGVPVPGCNSPHYAVSPSGCWYGPNWRFQGPSLPPAPFNGMLAVPNRAGGYNSSKSDPLGGNPVSKQSVKPSVVEPW